jgi:glycosyltransferase involved in cell wall biosynthesis
VKAALSCFVLQGGRTGVSAYVVNLFAAMQAADRDTAYDVLVPAPDRDIVPVRGANVRRTVVPARWAHPVAAIAWHNLVLPVRSRREGYDLVHIPSYRRLPLVKGTRILATVHDLATLHLDAKYDAARMFFNRRIVPTLIRRADRIVTVSRYTRADLVNLVGYPADRIHVVYSGIDHTVYRPVPRDEARARLAESHGLDRPFLVFVSRVEHPAKNHVRLIRAFERLGPDAPDGLQLVFSGADWNGAAEVRAAAAASPKAKDIRFLGFAPLADLPLLYSACEVAVYPSLFEGFGFPIVEALACGAPVVCSNTSSMGEIAGDCVPKFDPTREDDIAAAIAAALRKGRSEDLSARGRAYAAGFTWEGAARATLDVYRRTAEESP